jgi:predicted ATPase
VEAELLYQRGLPPQAKYIFKHALIQDAAYESLLKSKRQQYHQRIAQVLEERFPEVVETQPELLAHHYMGAGLSKQAIRYWQKAGERGIGRSAYVEAMSHLTRGLELLKTLPDSPERAELELVLQTILGPALIAIKGFAAPEVEKAYTRARELCQHAGETPQLFPVLWGLYVFYLIRAELQTARGVAEQFLNLAQSLQDLAALVVAHRSVGVTLFYIGEFTSAREHLEQGIALYDSQQHHSYTFLYGFNPKVVCLTHVACTLWHLGYPDYALKRSNEALTLARELSHPLSLALALSQTAMFHQFCREGEATQERAEAAITLSTEQGFLYWLAMGTILRGRVLAEQGQGEKGVIQMRQGLAAYRATGAELARPYFLALLAEAYGKGGQAEEGLTVLSEALTAVHKTGERWWEAELYRLKGELLLALSKENQAEVEACFCQAIDIARHQSAKSLELRAVMSLSRLWQKQGKQEEARQVLAEIYGWFTEGFDTADLQEAKTLLEELES